MNDANKAVARLIGGCFYGTDTGSEWYYTKHEPVATCLFSERNLYIDENGCFYSKENDCFKKLED